MLRPVTRGLTLAFAVRAAVALTAALAVVLPATAAQAASWQAIVSDAQNAGAQFTSIDLLANLAGSPIPTPGGVSQLGVAITPDARRAYIVAVGSTALVPIDLTRRPPRVGTPIGLV